MCSLYITNTSSENASNTSTSANVLRVSTLVLIKLHIACWFVYNGNSSVSVIVASKLSP